MRRQLRKWRKSHADAQLLTMGECVSFLTFDSRLSRESFELINGIDEMGSDLLVLAKRP